MHKFTSAALVSGASVLAAVSSVAAQEAFFWEGEVEIGYESVFDSTAPGNIDDVAYGRAEVGFGYQFSNTVAVFGGLTFEEVEDPGGATGYGFYIHELGLEFGLNAATIQLGKISPTFGTAWDNAAGFYSASLAEDYELTEQIGGLADVDLGGGSTLSLGVFFADTSLLSESAGFNRTRNSRAAGGAGNTGKLNNAALQWTWEGDSAYAYAGARYLSAGQGDASDETGLVAGGGYSFTGAGVPLDLFAEIAAFDGYGGSTDSATYATLNAAYAIGNLTLSGAYSRRDIDSAGVADLITIGAEYEFDNGILLGAGLARLDDAGTRDDLFGLNVVIPLGG